MAMNPRNSIPYHIYRIQRRSEAFGRRVLAPLGVTKEQMFYIGTLVLEGDGITQEALAERVGVDKSTAARMIGSLERAGLVRRTRVRGNARAYSVRLTARGRRLHEKLLPALWQWHRVLTRGMSAADVRRALELLDRMRENVESACELEACEEVDR